MMPEMDGLEAAAGIRAMESDWCRKVPIIALTANAVFGARELFLENGMNDFLPKPVNTAELNRVLAQWLPKEMYTLIQKKTRKPVPPAKRLEPEKLIDRSVGIANAAGSEPFYEQLLADFKLNHEADPEKIRKALDTEDFTSAKRLAHTLKSTAALIGAKTLADTAQTMEQALIDNLSDPGQEMWDTLERECSAVFAGIESKKSETIEEKAETGIIIDKTRILAFINRLEDLLKINSTKSLDLLDELREILAPTGVEYRSLTARIENFDFSEAGNLLNGIKEKLSA
jgi:CheY-like chemotaxis protein